MTRLSLAAVLVALAAAPAAADGPTGPLVSAATRGAAVSEAIGGRAFPVDPIRGATVRTIVSTLPPNPIRDGGVCCVDGPLNE